jgi:hypothetical protein
MTTSIKAALLGGLMGLGLASAPAAADGPAAFDDWAQRSPDIHWPHGHAPSDADLFAHNALRIDAPCATVWQHIVEAPKWPAWYPNSRDVKITNGHGAALRKGSRFTWQTFGLDVASEIHEFVPQSRIGWFGYGKDVVAYHTWLLTPAGQGCQVVMEEVVEGAGAVAWHRSDPEAMHKGHDLWLSTLKTLSEK